MGKKRGTGSINVEIPGVSVIFTTGSISGSRRRKPNRSPHSVVGKFAHKNVQIWEGFGIQETPIQMIELMRDGGDGGDPENRRERNPEILPALLPGFRAGLPCRTHDNEHLRAYRNRCQGGHRAA
jgi:hypothetical protein